MESNGSQKPQVKQKRQTCFWARNCEDISLVRRAFRFSCIARSNSAFCWTPCHRFRHQSLLWGKVATSSRLSPVLSTSQTQYRSFFESVSHSFSARPNRFYSRFPHWTRLPLPTTLLRLTLFSGECSWDDSNDTDKGRLVFCDRPSLLVCPVRVLWERTTMNKRKYAKPRLDHRMVEHA